MAMGGRRGLSAVVGFAGAAVSSIFHAWNAAFDALRLKRGG